MKITWTILAAAALAIFAGMGIYHHFIKNPTEDRGGAEELDGNYTYVDNEKLLEHLAGEWTDEGGRFALSIQKDGSISIIRNGRSALEDTLQFSYLQPGYVASTEFELSRWELTGPDGSALGTVCSLRHEAAEDVISMEIEDADGTGETIAFKKTEE